ncbi:MAG TPA: prephenate dehydrogenase/arogenate dehydrogenase family protein [Nitrospinota bacterium]|nr:prephenate dehydrogenase/arogenate dehydrogenase family protein [Nitrospinota bacterium]|tara:strand:+ start:15678 stop:16550 length:873 start_codon:yes stop_codon:yes gene_type:complete
MKPLFEHIVIAGVGLIGGSLGIAGKKAGVFGKVTGVGRKTANLELALEKGLVDQVSTNLASVCHNADIFFAATPSESISNVCLEAAKYLPDQCVITDGGSVKKEIVVKIEKELPNNIHFIGGHPIAGTEKSGAGAAIETLFQNRYTILTPTKNTDAKAKSKVKEMWQTLGSDVRLMDPEEHDQAMAVISHLPHFAAYALVETILGADPSGEIQRFVAGGFNDTTRIAASDPKMWRDIFSMNRKPLLKSIEQFEQSITSFKEAILNDEFDKLQNRLKLVKTARKSMDDHCK